MAQSSFSCLPLNIKRCASGGTPSVVKIAFFTSAAVAALST